MKARIWYGARRPHQHYGGAYKIARFLTTDSRNRLSNFWAPTVGLAEIPTTRNSNHSTDGKNARTDISHDLLIRGGFLRQAHSGVFHILPLGLRVQNKLENLIDKHMSSLGASKVSLSSISTEALWKQSGRYSTNSELLQLKDRKDSGFLLSPTHEEEITSMVASMVHSYKDLPLRLYQIGRKYRDERRPRGGLLRAKEFLMKDLYTFDYSQEAALQTYEAVREAYKNFFDELKIPYLVADADSGNMGGKLSHEYHFVSPLGEDMVWSCNKYDYVANEELVEKRVATDDYANSRTLNFTGISVDRTTRINIQVPVRKAALGNEKLQMRDFINFHAVKRAGVDIDTSVEPQTLKDLLPKTTQTISIYDRSLLIPDLQSEAFDLTITQPGDSCPRCGSGKLDVQSAIEAGHTFHLSTRYSTPLNALVTIPDQSKKVPIQMGCHGIGISRLIAAVASILHDQRGLNWPCAIAPFEAVIITSPQTPEEDSTRLYDTLRSSGVDVVLDDRPDKSLGWKLKDADLIGYPVILVLGRVWKENRAVEVQCRRLAFKQNIQTDLKDCVMKLLGQL